MPEAANVLPAGSVLSFDTNLLINIAIQWFNVLLLTGVLVFLLYKPVKEFMRKRALRIGSDLESAGRAKDEARLLKREYERKLAELDEEREEILLQAHRKAVQRGDQVVREAREKAEILMIQAQEQAEWERKRNADRIKEEIIELSTAIAGRYIEASIDEGLRDRLVDQAFQDWEKVS